MSRGRSPAGLRALSSRFPARSSTPFAWTARLEEGCRSRSGEAARRGLVGFRVVDQEPPRRLWAARFVAPLAFFAAATTLIVLVQRGLDGGSTDTATTATPTVTSPTTTAGTPSTPA